MTCNFGKMSISNIFSRRQITALCVVLLMAIAGVTSICIFFCSHSYPHELVAVDSLCENRPDTAKILLMRISKNRLTAKADRFYYDLLMIKACNNLYEPQKDSTIFHVVDYFKNHGDRSKKREAYYYLGKYYIEHNDALQALKCFQIALDLSDDETPLAFKSKVYNQSGGLFLDQNLYNEALSMYRKSFVCDSILRDTVNVIHSLRDMAQIYRHLEKPDSCKALLDKAFFLLNYKNMPFLKKTIALAQVSLYLSENNTKCAHRVFSEYLIDVEDNIKSPAYAAAVSIYRRIGDEDSAFIYSKRLMSIGTLNAKETALEFLIDYYSAHGDYNRVRRCIEKYKQISDSIRTVNVSEAIMKIHSLYDYSLKEKENEKLKSIVQRRGFVSTLLVLFLFFIIAFILYHRERTKKKYEKVKYMHEHLEQLYKTAYVQYDVSLKQKENEIIRLKKELDKLNNGSVEEKEKMRIYEILRNKIKNNTKISEKSWNDILESINLIYPTFKQKLVGTFGLDNDEYKICILVKLGLLNIEIATIMCKSPGAITQKRSSMSKKIFNGNGNSKDFNVFIKSIE